MEQTMAETIGGIIWDWNGTLLNDIELCVQTINDMLQKRNLRKLTADEYKDVFSFPVKDYYQKIGFDFNAEPFEIPAREFIDNYNTVHDFEVASELGCQCVLIANGHQSKYILESTGVLVIDELNQLLGSDLQYYRRLKRDCLVNQP